MKLNRVGFVGWRGMVGSVLQQRMLAEDDFAMIDEPTFLTTSQVGMPGPNIGNTTYTLADAHDLELLQRMDVIVTCQGGGYTSTVHPKLRQCGWQGYWIDAASTLRMDPQATIVLDPVNRPLIDQALNEGKRDFIGGNCTVSLMMMALNGLFKADLIEWISVATYQAISGGGARQMRELIVQMGQIHANADTLLRDTGSAILELDGNVTDTIRSKSLVTNEIGYPLAGNLLPWIDEDRGSGTSREEWKGWVETNKILGRTGHPIPIESTCIRIATMRCHSQSFTIKLNTDVPLDEIENLIESANEWTTVVPGGRTESLDRLHPANVSGTLNIPVGRVRKLAMGDQYMAAFTVGDQLLWGAAEPLRRMLRILQQHR